MCTALSYQAGGHYFGRTLDIDRSYGEKVCVMPRNFPLTFRQAGRRDSHYAMIGMAAVAEGTPLYYDAANEKGLSMAGLNFPKTARYGAAVEGRDNLAPFELIPWVLCQCATAAEARVLLERLCILDLSFSPQLPVTGQHWLVSDAETSLVVEPMEDGVRVYENPVGVLTNNPPFPYQMFHLNNYRGLSRETPENRFSGGVDLDVYCQGLGALGLPGDVSSMSRFVRMAFNSQNSVCPEDELSAVGQFFHLMDSVSMIRGCCRTDDGAWDVTVYTSCISTALGRYYYTTYEDRQIRCVDLHREDLDGRTLSVFPIAGEEQVRYRN